MFKVISFYKFVELGSGNSLRELKERLMSAMRKNSVHGTIIIAEEGYNGMVSGVPGNVDSFVSSLASVLGPAVEVKETFADEEPMGKLEVKIKPEIVTLRRAVDLSLGQGTHVPPEQWNELIKREDVFLLDTRNDYEYRTGTFEGAVNPETAKFSDLPDYVERYLDPTKHSRVAVFCTGGIRCEKFVPYLKSKGFNEVYQLRGGILRYLERIPPEESLWRGECFVFDKRVTLSPDLSVGSGKDLSGRKKTASGGNVDSHRTE